MSLMETVADLIKEKVIPSHGGAGGLRDMVATRQGSGCSSASPAPSVVKPASDRRRRPFHHR